MSTDKLPLTPIVKNRRLSALSSAGKVHSAFKSPYRSPSNSTPLSPSNNEVVISPAAARTPKTFSRKRRSALANSFVSPLKSKILKPEVEKQDLNELKQSIKAQEKEIAELQSEGVEEQELKIYIDKLHEYNEIKDTAQIVIGRLAIQLQTTSRELHAKFGLNPDD